MYASLDFKLENLAMELAQLNMKDIRLTPIAHFYFGDSKGVAEN